MAHGGVGGAELRGSPLSRSILCPSKSAKVVLGRVLMNRDCSAIAGCRKRHVRCAEGSADFLTPSPPAKKKTTARQD
jgi:hypothetical protein